jgi:Zn-finger nucleic acid-binding protein
MKCAVCKTVTLTSTTLDDHLPARTCGQCGGVLLSARDYWRWLDSRSARLPERSHEGPAITALDSPHIKTCAECGHLMLRYSVGHSTSIALDQCGACHAMWLDRGEWESLKARNLHDEVHLVFTAPWQSAVRREEARVRLDAIYRQRFGSDYGEVTRIRDWVTQHPERDKIVAFLTDRDPCRAN